MASSLTAACRASARRVAAAAAAAAAPSRGLGTSSRCLAAHNFVMPALSPTMTEGNIAGWKVKEGDAFSAGDVLLEIETDKATMDVEAQDDGVMMKIMSADGAKAVQVGTRIAVLAEAGDDIAALEIPPDEQKQSPSPPSAAASAVAGSKDGAPPAAEARPARQTTAPGGQRHEQRHPLMPAVEHLVKQHGLSADDVAGIKPTGPGGRLLKGDVLAFVGAIDAAAPSAVSSRLGRLAHLDLSNIKLAPATSPPPPKEPAAAAQPSPPPPPPALEEVNVPVSLAKVVEAQRRIRDALGVFLPVSTFVSRAAELANDDLPPAARPPTPAELFDQILGLDKLKAAAAAPGCRGAYLPQISAVPPASALAAPPRPARKADIIDELAPRRPSRPSPSPSTALPTVPGLSSGLNVFSLVVPRAEEHRAHVFLERCKQILEQEPARLVL